MNPALYVVLSLGQFVVPYLLFVVLVLSVRRRRVKAMSTPVRRQAPVPSGV